VRASFRETLAAGGAFQGYAYAYPHKTAYRRLEPPTPLREAWAEEDRQALFLYAHIPFCEMRCGFCNLFTTTNPGPSLVTAYLDALERQAGVVADALGDGARLARLAIGGGTPSFLGHAELERLFALLTRHFPDVAAGIPKSVEVSPATVEQDKLELFAAWKVTRISIGIQSFLEAETRRLGRPQQTAEVRRALGLLSAREFPCLNVDLIYGVPGQTGETWRRSLEHCFGFRPQEIYLYPLYIRPLTGLDRLGSRPADSRLELYRLGRDFLLARGYRQVSMRLFRLDCYKPPEGPVYCCQEDGMVGLGAGARSYTAGLHYSTEYAVGREGIQAVINRFVTTPAADFGTADYGCRLDEQEQRRRYVLKSLLRVDGLSLARYRDRFGSELLADFPGLMELLEGGMAEMQDEWLRLNESGLELSDVIGPWLCSPNVREKMEGFVLT
jgi:oxygen-independent coproporphyrinogen-3 oxidase